MCRIVWLALLGCLFGLSISHAERSAVAVSEDPAAQGRALASLRATIGRIQAQMEATQNKRSVVNQALQRSEVQIGKVSHRLHLLRQEQVSQQRHLVRLQARQRSQQHVLQQQRDMLQQQVQAAYRMGHQEQLKLMLNQQDPNQMSRMLTYYGYINRARMAHMHTLERQLQQVAETRHQVEQQQAQLVNLQNVQIEARNRLHQSQQSRRNALREMDVNLERQGNRLRQLQADAQQMQRLIDQLQRALAEQAIQQNQNFAKQRGRLRWPTPGRIIHTFGSQKVGDIRWDGVLIHAKAGRPVVAIHAGRVIFSDWLRGVGLLVIIDHGAGYMSLYGHNQQLSKSVGDWVKAGETIALVGETGGQRTAGLYFAIRHAGIAVDPGRWCQKLRGRDISRILLKGAS